MSTRDGASTRSEDRAAWAARRAGRAALPSGRILASGSEVVVASSSESVAAGDARAEGPALPATGDPKAEATSSRGCSSGTMAMELEAAEASWVKLVGPLGANEARRSYLVDHWRRCW